jgi:hypothetical protein
MSGISRARTTYGQFASRVLPGTTMHTAAKLRTVDHDAPKDDECWLASKMVRERYGVSDMSLWRWTNQPKLGLPPFPTAVMFNGRKRWQLGQLRQWDAAVTAATAEAPSKNISRK